MCAFFSSPIFSHPTLAGYTYYLRLDTDSFIEAPLCYDPFEVMHVRKRVYGYRYLGMDPPEVTHGMWAFVSMYARSHPEAEKRNLDMGKNGKGAWPEAETEHYPGFYNNFEIVKLEAFRRPDVQEWLSEVMSDPKRAFKYRWGLCFSLT
jgi:mannosyltransferase